MKYDYKILSGGYIPLVLNDHNIHENKITILYSNNNKSSKSNYIDIHKNQSTGRESRTRFWLLKKKHKWKNIYKINQEKLHVMSPLMKGLHP